MDPESALELLDTDVVIEFSRGHRAAIEFVSTLKTSVVTIPSMVAMEFVIGSRNQVELNRSRRLLSQLEVLEVDPSDFKVGYGLMEKHLLSTGLSLADYLIAAQALNRNAILYSFNLKHFRPIPGLDVRQPYARADG